MQYFVKICYTIFVKIKKIGVKITMAINIEKQGLRKGYIAGGIFAILLAAVLVILYFPTFLQDLFNISPIWDLRTPITIC